MSQEGLLQDVSAHLLQRAGLAVVHRLWRHVANSAMTMRAVVPKEEALAVSAGVLDTAKALRKLGAVLERLELCLGVRIVIGHMRAAVGLGDLQIDQQLTTALERMLEPRSACSVSVAGSMRCLATVLAINFFANAADSRGATIQPTA